MTSYLRTPFTDVFGPMMTHQMLGLCRDFEMRFVDCMEAYGVDKGSVVCNDFREDLSECMSNNKKNARIRRMKYERLKQFASGDRSYRDYYPPSHPPFDTP